VAWNPLPINRSIGLCFETRPIALEMSLSIIVPRGKKKKFDGKLISCHQPELWPREVSSSSSLAVWFLCIAEG
jgi:hypothetical protein